MKLAIMQPYLFPYVGYYQLAEAVDKFIFLDDVSFIKRGYINRNSILDLKQQRLQFSVPLSKVSQNKSIKDTLLHDNYTKWQEGFFKTINHCYSKAPYFKTGVGLLVSVLKPYKPGDSIADLCRSSIIHIANHLGIQTKFVTSSGCYGHELTGSDRIIDICVKENADSYINAIGGKKLYTQQSFHEKGIKLRFLSHKPVTYAEHQVPYLSIIDLLMHCDPANYKTVLQSYEEVE